MNFTVEQLLDYTEKWLTSGELNDLILADDFQFISPYWKSNSREEFIAKFQGSQDYQRVLVPCPH